MSYGFVAIADNGNLLASSESANYELSQYVASGSRTGNVTTYSIFPVPNAQVFAVLPVGGSAGILQIAGGVVKVIGNGNYPIKVYKRISPPSGYGVSVYDSAGAPTFKTSADMLNAQAVSVLPIGGVVTSSASAVSYPSVASYTTALTTQSGWKHVGYIVKTAYLYGYTLGGWAYPNGVPTWDPYLQTYASIQVNFYYSYQVKVITTDWVVYRSTAKNDGGTKSFEWSVHASGYYKVITNSQVVYSHYLQVGTGTITQNISTIIGDVPAADAGIISDSKSLFEPQVGAYSSGSRFPYSNGETRSTTGTIVTS